MRQLTALGGDIFAGLFTVGIQAAGYKVLGHLEHGSYGSATARKNFPDLEIRVGPHTWEPVQFKGKVDLMFTNPPCAAWSSMGRRADGIHKPWQEQTERLSCVTDLVHAGTIIQPKAWCWESVTNAWSQGQEFVLEQARIWNQHGYHCTILLQNNMYVGSTQARERMFLIAHLHPLVWPLLTQPRTTDQLLKTVPRRLPKPPLEPAPLPPRTAELWRRAEGHGYLRRIFDLMSTEELAKLPGPIPMAVVRRLRGDRPPPVMIEDMKRLHPREPRALTYYEWLALTGLPWTWQTGATSFSSFSLELSRAVMPGVGQWLGTAVRDGLAQRALRKKDGVVTTRLVDLRGGPDKEPVERVLEQHQTQGPLTPPAWEPTPPVVKASRAVQSTPRPGRPGLPARPGSGLRIREMLQQGLGTQEILEVIHREFPQSKATSADVSWNRAKLRQLQQKDAA